MEKETIILLLTSINEKNRIDVPLPTDQIIDAIRFATAKDLVTRTDQGNFLLSTRGLSLVNNELPWEKIVAGIS
ncbi:MAG: hypothetical protein JSU01_19925 [Bacteroidetes bacterium]|nr:hypothetical protein [Bacteroidota bacterium]